MKSITLMSFLLLSIAGISNFDCNAAAAGYVAAIDEQPIKKLINSGKMEDLGAYMIPRGYRSLDILSSGETILGYAEREATRRSTQHNRQMTVRRDFVFRFGIHAREEADKILSRERAELYDIRLGKQYDVIDFLQNLG